MDPVQIPQQQEIQTPQTTSPQPTPSTKSSGKLVLLLVIFIIVIALVAGLYVMKLKNSNITLSQQITPSPVPTIQPTITKPAIHPTSITNIWNTSLKNFTNPAINISFQYPAAFVTSDQLSSYKNTQPDMLMSLRLDYEPQVPQNIMITGFDEQNYFLGVNISATKNSSHKSLRDAIADEYKDIKGPSNNSEVSYLMQNLQPIDNPIPNSYQFIGELGETTIKIVFFQNKDIVYAFTLFGATGAGGGYSKNQEIFFNKLLSTIKFQ